MLVRVEILEHVAASRAPERGYRDPLARVEGTMAAEARRPDASTRKPWGFAVLAVLAGVLCWMLAVGGSFVPLGLLLAGVMALSTGAAMRAWARVLARLRLEVRDGRLIARSIDVWERRISIATASVTGIDLASIDVDGARHVALVARLVGDRTVTLLEPLSAEDAESFRDLASSALGLGSG